MLLNHNGMKPSDYEEMRPESFCPECRSPLYKRGGGIGKCIEHWAHYPDKDRECMNDIYMQGKESEWHLYMKSIFFDFGFNVEVKVSLTPCRHIDSSLTWEKHFRVDAAKGYNLFEFINSMSANYEDKAVSVFTSAMYKLTWIFNGDAFFEGSERGLVLTGSRLRFVKRVHSLYQNCFIEFNGFIYNVKQNGMVDVKNRVGRIEDYAKRVKA